MLNRRILLAVGLVLTGALIGLNSRPHAQSARRAAVELQQPTNWVPFTADVAVTLQDGTRQKGRFYRNSVGSQRWDLTRESDGRTLIEISDVWTSRYLKSWGDRKWTSQPTDIDPARHKPIRFTSETKGLDPYPYKLDIAAGSSGNIRAAVGFDAYKLTLPNGDVQIRVPALNFFAVVLNALGHYTKMYNNIVIGEPSPSLFGPPPGDQVTQIEKMERAPSR